MSMSKFQYGLVVGNGCFLLMALRFLTLFPVMSDGFHTAMFPTTVPVETGNNPCMSHGYSMMNRLFELKVVSKCDEIVVPEDKNVLDEFSRDANGICSEDDDEVLGDFEDAMSFICGEDFISELKMIEVLGKEKHTEAAEQCEAALFKFLQLYDSGIYANFLEKVNSESPMRVSIDAFNSCLHAWAKSKDPLKGEKAEAILTMMSKYNDVGVSPNIVSWTCVLNSWTKSDDREHVFRADRILREMQNLFEQGISNVEPDSICNTVVIQGFTKLAKKGDKAAARRAQSILDKMEKKYLGGKSNQPPDRFIYQSVLNAWALSNVEESGENAHDILRKMAFRAKLGEDMEPTRKNYASVILAYLNLKKCTDAENALTKSTELLGTLYELYKAGNGNMKPSGEIYRAFIYAWARTGGREGAIKADYYLHVMLTDFEEGFSDVLPKTRTFNAVIEAWLRSDLNDSVQKILHILKRMENLSSESLPNERSYTNFIRALSSSKVPLRANKAYNVIKRMNLMVEKGNRYARPTEFSYNAVLSACANDVGNEEAFDIAIKAFGELTKNSKPDSVSYNNLLRVCLLLDENKRKSIAKAAFKQCSNQGFVKRNTIYVLRDLLSDEDFYSLTGTLFVDNAFENIPIEWKRNAEAKATRRKPRGRN